MAITLGLVEAIDSNGVYVSMPGSRGVLRGPYETLQNVVAGDKVLVVTTDDGDCVVVGLAAAAVAGVSIPDGSITSAKIANGTIVDEDISASAAIAKTKISGTAITAADTGTVTSTMIADGTIVNADISGSAAIDKTKVSGTAITAADTGTVTNAMLAGSIAASKITGTAITAADSGTVTSTMIANSTIVNADISPSAAIARSKISGLPTSSTDNAVARFDGTGGAVQDSGVAIADNNTVSGVNNLYFAGTLFGDGGAASSMLVANANAGVSTDVRLRSGGNERWIIQKTNEAESGSNAGSNFRLYRRADDGSGLSYPITINRATGKITFGDVGSAAGLEMGASGPTITTGTGAPSHSAPNGSIYLRTDGTASTTLYVRAAGAWTALS